MQYEQSLQDPVEAQKKKYLLKTLGCKANFYDTQLLEVELQKRGWVPAEEGDSEDSVDLCVVNSCTVTDEADKQSRKLASRLKKNHPASHVVFTGCGAEVAPSKMADTRGVSFVVGNQSKPQLVDLVLKAIDSQSPEQEKILGTVLDYPVMTSRHPMDREWPLPDASFLTTDSLSQGQAVRTRAFLKIQEGCDSFCTYCVIPYGRGPSRSLAIEPLVEQVKSLVQQGIREVILTGTNLGDFGSDWSESRTPQLEALVRAILEQTTLERLRVSSLDPTEVSAELVDLMRTNPRFCPHIHLSLQSPHSKILKLMKRKYDSDRVVACLGDVASVERGWTGPFVGMDVITGFPGESEEDFLWGVERLRELHWNRLHVFPYSEREGTPATRLPNSVPQSERTRRTQILLALSLERLKQRYGSALEAIQKSESGLLEDVLLESEVRGPDPSRKWIAGYSKDYLRVVAPCPEGVDPASLQNQILKAKPESLWVDRASGEVSFLGVWAD